MEQTRTRILIAAMKLIRENGYASTRVDDLCAEAGVTKGAFFHHFKSKEEMATEAAQFFSSYADKLFESAPFQQIKDPYLRLMGYIDFRESLLQGEAPAYTCLLGTMVQEVHLSHPALRESCQSHIWSHAETLIPTIEAALKDRMIVGILPLELALFTQATLQGAFILAKASQSPEPAQASVRHLRRYLEQLFNP